MNRAATRNPLNPRADNDRSNTSWSNRFYDRCKE